MDPRKKTLMKELITVLLVYRKTVEKGIRTLTCLQTVKSSALWMTGEVKSKLDVWFKLFQANFSFWYHSAAEGVVYWMGKKSTWLESHFQKGCFPLNCKSEMGHYCNFFTFHCVYFMWMASHDSKHSWHNSLGFYLKWKILWPWTLFISTKLGCHKPKVPHSLSASVTSPREPFPSGCMSKLGTALCFLSTQQY